MRSLTFMLHQGNGFKSCAQAAWLCACLATGLGGQAVGGIVIGRVVDGASRPVVDAPVVLTDTTSSRHPVTRTDPDGRFRFFSVAVGGYAVRVTRPGARPLII